MSICCRHSLYYWLYLDCARAQAALYDMLNQSGERALKMGQLTQKNAKTPVQLCLYGKASHPRIR